MRIEEKSLNSRSREKNIVPHLVTQLVKVHMCKVICARLRNKARRVRHDLNVLLRIYILFHLPEYIMEKKKMIAGYSPSQKSVILTSSVCVLCPSVIFPGSCSQLFLLPFYLCYTADIFAQYLLVC